MIAVKKILIVIANAHRALFYLAHGPNHVLQMDAVTTGSVSDETLKTYPFELKNTEYQDDHSMFSKQVVTQIDKILNDEHLDELCICAGPKFLGLLNNDRIKKHIKIVELNKEFTNVRLEDVPQIIQEAGLNFMPS